MAVLGSHGRRNLQYESRLSTWDFDITTFGWRTTQLPGNGLRDYWGSRAADELGTDNVVGIKNTAVDAMIDRVIFANSYDELVAAARALDRILLWHYYVVPQWSYNKQRTARWDRFGHPAPLPQYGISGFPALWWWDADKAAKGRSASVISVHVFCSAIIFCAGAPI